MAQDKRKLGIRILVIAAMILALGAFVVIKIRGGEGPGDDRVTPVSATDDKAILAQCLTDKGAKMDGASWCPHCAQQKKDFGAAFKSVTYVECAIPGDNSQQTQICKDNNIKGYPTWRFADGTEKTGEQTLEDLASAAGCKYGSVTGAAPAVPTNVNVSAGGPLAK